MRQNLCRSILALTSLWQATPTPRPPPAPIEEKARFTSFYMILGPLSTDERACNIDCRRLNQWAAS